MISRKSKIFRKFEKDSQIKTIIFDWGGVLTTTQFTQSLTKTLARKFNLDGGAIFKTVDSFFASLDSGAVEMEDHFDEFIAQLSINITISEFDKLIKESVHHNLDVIDLIKKLKKEYKLFILSDNNDHIVSILKKDFSKDLKLFDKTYFSYVFKLTKPSREIFELVVDENKLKPKECIFIDDKQKNIDGAVDVGMQGIVFTDAGNLKSELVKLGVKID